MSIYDDARAAINSISAANAALNTAIAGHSDLAGLAAMEADVTAMTNLVNRAETAAQPMPLVKGLISVNGKQTLPHVQNVTCNVYWKDIQLVAGGALVPNNAIDQFLKSGLPGRVRLFLGRHSPAWTHNIAGTVTTVDQGLNGVSPKWWDVLVQAAQKDLINKLAVAYDGKISLIFAATPMSIYAEPFQRGISDPTTRTNLLAAGYTRQLDQDSYEAMFQMFSAFKKTRVGVAFNPHQYVTAGGAAGTDVAFTNAMMDRFRVVFGPDRAVVQNNSISTPESPSYLPMYQHMTKPLSFQTATASRIGDYAKTLDYAVSVGAHAVEAQSGYQTALTDSQLAHYDAALRAN